MSKKSKIGDVIELQKQDVKVEKCKDCSKLMVNIDAKDTRPGDLVTLKRKGVLISNPLTKDPICIKCEVEKEPSYRERLADWFTAPVMTTVPTPTRSSYDDDDDDDSSFFGGSSSSSSSFGGFSGGMFSGGGASRGF